MRNLYAGVLYKGQDSRPIAVYCASVQVQCKSRDFSFVLCEIPCIRLVCPMVNRALGLSQEDNLAYIECHAIVGAERRCKNSLAAFVRVPVKEARLCFVFAISAS